MVKTRRMTLAEKHSELSEEVRSLRLELSITKIQAGALPARRTGDRENSRGESRRSPSPSSRGCSSSNGDHQNRNVRVLEMRLDKFSVTDLIGDKSYDVIHASGDDQGNILDMERKASALKPISRGVWEEHGDGADEENASIDVDRALQTQRIFI
jgi:hypothetical protein